MKRLSQVEKLPPPPPPGSDQVVHVPIDLFLAYLDLHGLEFVRVEGFNTLICKPVQND